MRGCGRRYYRASGESIGGEYREDIWVKSCGLEPFYWRLPARLASLLVRSVGLI